MVRKTKLNWESVCWIIILAVGAFLRLYQIQNHASFLGDEGRDALVVRQMLVEGRLTLLGPTVSFGNLYLGPIYYYLMVPAMWLSRLDPIGPAVMVAGFGVLALVWVWRLARRWFGLAAALAASAMYAVSPVVINHTRSSWNPNPVPFFALLTIDAFDLATKTKSKWWWLVTGASLAILVQLHYMTLVFVALVVAAAFYKRFKNKLIWGEILVLALGFGLFLSPQVAFELRHNFVNFKAMLDLFSGRGQFAGLARVGIEQLKPWLVISRLWGHIFLTERLPLGIGVGTVCLLIFWKKYFRSLLNWWLIAGTFGVSFYEGIMHDHYLGFLFPVPFLVFGAAVAILIRVRELRWLITVLAFVLVFLSFWQTDLPQNNNGDKQIERTKIVAGVIAGDVGEKKFNLAIKSVTGDYLAMNYRYFLEYFGEEPEEYGDFKGVERLYVIEEKDWDDPGRLGLWETGAFGPYKIGGHWHFDFQKELYRLDRQE